MSEAESDFLSFPKIIKVAKKRAQMLRQFAQSPELNLKQREAAKSTAIVARQQVEDTKKRQAEIRAGAQIVKANTEQTRE